MIVDDFHVVDFRVNFRSSKSCTSLWRQKRIIRSSYYVARTTRAAQDPPLGGTPVIPSAFLFAKTESGCPAQLIGSLLDGDRPIILRNVVNPSLPAGECMPRRIRCIVNVEGSTAGG